MSQHLKINDLLLYVLCVLGGCLFLHGTEVLGAEQTEKNNPAPVQIHEVSFAREPKGKALYQHYCAVCHGPTGGGDGLNAYNLDPKPRNFADLSIMSTRSDEELYRVITQGGTATGKSPLMPPWGRVLKEKEVREIIAYLRAFTGSGSHEGIEK